ncbi:MAG: hypothetical protein ACTSPY_10120 [Candidatus Helarchaeota archaeon]
MAIQNVLILQPNGTLIFSKDYHSIKENPVIISGFLTAIDSFAQSIGAGSKVHTIETDEYKFVGDISEKYKIKFIVICEKDDDIKQARYLLKSCKRSFIMKFNKLLNTKKPFHNIEKFKEWEPNLDKIVNKSELSSFETVVSKTIHDLKKIFEEVEKK